jgi:hypothetical protein
MAKSLMQSLMPKLLRYDRIPGTRRSFGNFIYLSDTIGICFPPNGFKRPALHGLLVYSPDSNMRYMLTHQFRQIIGVFRGRTRFKIERNADI